MIILRNAETHEQIPYTKIVGPHKYTVHGTEMAFVHLQDGRGFHLKRGETISVMEDGQMVDWEVYNF